MSTMKSAVEFLKSGGEYQLGFLETEQPNPLTSNLSDLALNDRIRAIEVLARVDHQALEIFKNKIPDILVLRKEMQETLSSGGRIFICGCGATGRLALTIESLFRQQSETPTQENRVIAFMAGGDVALVHSLEGFEDFPAYGARHLEQLDFRDNDLLIAATEGGETPYVIGATEWACQKSKRNPYFLYCNPEELLLKNVERSRRVIENEKIKKINLSVGRMALAGSTRMQASTVLQLCIGYALLTELSAEEIAQQIRLMQTYLNENVVPFLLSFVNEEANEYLAGNFIIYRVSDYSISVFTDTTERAPTFSLTPFSHRKAERLLKLPPSKSYICVPETKTADEAWRKLLMREPRPLNWSEIDMRTESSYLREFDFSLGAIEFRKWLTDGKPHAEFEIFKHRGSLFFRLNKIERSILWPASTNLLFEHTVLKMFLNIHSTLVMGQLRRYQDNLMTWVYPTNGKLIDRAARYVMQLLKNKNIKAGYDDVVRKIFELKEVTPNTESLVLAVFNQLKK